jgi:hypothetical protein
MTMTGEIAANLSRVRHRIATTCERCGRDASEITLVAVSKTQSAQAILAAAAAGLQHFGENRVEEASEKIPAVNCQTPESLIWHMVGHIQSRKVRMVPSLFQLVHSVDSLKLATRLSHTISDQQGSLNILLQINVSGEASKSGLHATGWMDNPVIRDNLWHTVEQINALPGLNVRGLMTMAPIVADAEQTRPVFAGLVALRAALVDTLEIALPELSMGMTDDYPVAIEEGATIVRVGRAIFGERH